MEKHTNIIAEHDSLEAIGWLAVLHVGIATSSDHHSGMYICIYLFQKNSQTLRGTGKAIRYFYYMYLI